MKPTSGKARQALQAATRSPETVHAINEWRLAVACLGLDRSWDSGVTDSDQRRERIRKEILHRCLGDVRCDNYRIDRAPRTFAEIFQSLYGVLLVAKDASK